jgi:hypothetical protein
VHINKKEITALINTEIKVSVILSNLTEKLRLFISYTFSVIMADVTGIIKRFLNLCEDVSINIKKIIYKVFI